MALMGESYGYMCFFCGLHANVEYTGAHLLLHSRLFPIDRHKQKDGEEDYLSPVKSFGGLLTPVTVIIL